jgi:hypothetical protein
MPDEPGHTAVIALEGNALAPSGAHSTITDPFRHSRESLAPVVELALDGWRACVVRGGTLPIAGPGAGTVGRIGDVTGRSLECALRRARSRHADATGTTRGEAGTTDAAAWLPSRETGRPGAGRRTQQFDFLRRPR